MGARTALLGGGLATLAGGGLARRGGGGSATLHLHERPTAVTTAVATLTTAAVTAPVVAARAPAIATAVVAVTAVITGLLLVTVRRAAGTVAGATLDAGLGHLGGEELDGADGVVVARDDEVDAVRVAVGVHHADDGDAEAVGLVHGDVLLLRVDDEDA